MEEPSDVFLKIFKNHWSEFKKKNPSYETDYYNSIIKKILNCGNAELGFTKYQCLCCGQDERIIGFSCKTLFCLRCSRLAAADFVNEVQSKLHPGVVYRHLILTMPDQLWPLFYRNRQEPEMYNLFFRTAWECIQDVICTVRRRKLKCGCLMVLHTTGRKSDYKPHLHVLLMDGGLEESSGRWIKFGKFPYEIMRNKWKYYLLKMIKEFSPTRQTIWLVNRLWRIYDSGFVFKILKGDLPENTRRLTRYIAKYLFRPSISLRRIRKYDEKKRTVTYEYLCHETHRKEIETTDVLTFIGRMVQQILPPRFQRVRYYGLQSTSSFKKSSEEIYKAFGNVEEEEESFEANVFVAEKKKVNFSDRVYYLTGQNPLLCKNCGRQMEVVKIWIKGKGTVYDLLAYLGTQATAPPKKKTSSENKIERIFDQRAQEQQMSLLDSYAV